MGPGSNQPPRADKSSNSPPSDLYIMYVTEIQILTSTDRRPAIIFDNIALILYDFVKVTYGRGTHYENYNSL